MDFMKGGIVRLQVVAMTALVCVGMWGCSDVTFEWYDERSKPSIAGFINDSFVVVTDCRGWYEDTETKWNSGYSTVTSCGHDRMMVYNYRVQEEGPRWSDSLANKYDGQRWFQMTDSVFWRWNGDDLYLWKVGEKAHEIRLSRKNEGCTQSFKIDRIRQWLDGKFIALGGKLNADGENCQYAVLDTVEKTLEYKRLNEKLEWIKKCDDVRAWGDVVVCLKRRDDELLNLLVNNEGKDSIYVKAIPFWDSMTVSLASLSFYGNLFYWAYVNSIDSEKWKIKLNPNVRPLSFPSFGEFVDEKKKLISY
ncbi:MAG: hypothetical protein IKN03_05775 [Fibrobacter sp.]|nr:hypothetical protein [Fibrobacter sp.]